MTAVAPPPGDAGRRLAPEPCLLALNSGSSSLKFGLYRMRAAGVECLLAGETERIGDTDARTQARDGAGRTLLDEAAPVPDQRAAVARLAGWLDDGCFPQPQAIGHRIVHGGPRLSEHCVIDAAVLDALHAASAFAPLHTGPALAVIAYCSAHFPAVPQAACLDTCFHARMPGVALMYLADDNKLTEMVSKAVPGSPTFIGPPEDPAGGDRDRQVLRFDGQVLVLKWVDPEIAKRYGTMVYVRCGG